MHVASFARIFFKDKFPYPGYQSFFLARDEELRRPQADTLRPLAEHTSGEATF